MRGGIAIEGLGFNQLSIDLVGQLNQLNKLDKYHDLIVFYAKHGVVGKPTMFSMMQLDKMWAFSGPVMATNLNTASKLIKCPRPPKKFFYVYDLEWLNDFYDVDHLASIYCHPSINLIARSQDHYNILKQCWKEPVTIIEDFNYEEVTREFARI